MFLPIGHPVSCLVPEMLRTLGRWITSTVKFKRMNILVLEKGMQSKCTDIPFILLKISYYLLVCYVKL